MSSEPTKEQLVSDLRDANRDILELRKKLSLADPFIELVEWQRNIEKRIESLEYRVSEDLD
jgi:hypothetical protein